MTNYNERLDEIIGDFDVWCKCESRECQRSVNYEQAKQAITSLIKELVAEAKPEKRITEADKLRSQGRRIVGSSPFVDVENDAFNAALNQFEQNLLKAFDFAELQALKQPKGGTK